MKKPYPHNNDIRGAVLEVLAKDPLIKPDEFVERVRESLEEKGFYAGLVTPKRIWKIYEELVRSGEIYDYLGVVQGMSSENSF
ncbi:MAG: hypothetical protein ACP5II_04390 [Infirmifilum sp.]|uniref:Uncharacterized protein n=1 Tax=Infirmifilum uzonense TaxID=1550241 RepID=A0A0F7FIN2_9CREN|nr:hypothetical protein [Infirmifilum uzonense]AKG39098.1 hypothetical protein MA03_07375 [Infirmifilum uzonense]